MSTIKMTTLKNDEMVYRVEKNSDFHYELIKEGFKSCQKFYWKNNTNPEFRITNKIAKYKLITE